MALLNSLPGWNPGLIRVTGNLATDLSRAGFHHGFSATWYRETAKAWGWVKGWVVLLSSWVQPWPDLLEHLCSVSQGAPSWPWAGGAARKVSEHWAEQLHPKLCLCPATEARQCTDRATQGLGAEHVDTTLAIATQPGHRKLPAIPLLLESLLQKQLYCT